MSHKIALNSCLMNITSSDSRTGYEGYELGHGCCNKQSLIVSSLGRKKTADEPDWISGIDHECGVSHNKYAFFVLSTLKEPSEKRDAVQKTLSGCCIYIFCFRDAVQNSWSSAPSIETSSWDAVYILCFRDAVQNSCLGAVYIFFLSDRLADRERMAEEEEIQDMATICLYFAS